MRGGKRRRRPYMYHHTMQKHYCVLKRINRSAIWEAQFVLLQRGADAANTKDAKDSTVIQHCARCAWYLGQHTGQIRHGTRVGDLLIQNFGGRGGGPHPTPRIVWRHAVIRKCNPPTPEEGSLLYLKHIHISSIGINAPHTENR